jgi:predicted enzyme related to lactoylglutathione lyase
LCKPSVRLYRVILPVSDIERASQFYAAILGDEGNRVSRGRHYFDCGGTILACYDPVADGDDLGEGWHPHFNQYLYFAVQDLESTLEHVSSADGTILDGIQTYPWGERCFYAKDPFGNPIAFVEGDTVFSGDGYFK